MAELLKGAPVAAALTEELKERAEALKASGIVPTLAILRVGEKTGDISYETGASKRCEKIGIAVRKYIFPADASREELISAVKEINEDPQIHGLLLLRPLPDKKTEQEICAMLDPDKDMDCMTQGALAGVFAGRKSNGFGYPPCTAEAVMEILRYYQVELTGKHAAVVGRSLVIGRPVAMMLMNANATVTICHTKTPDTAEICRNSDIIVAAAGHIGTVSAACMREGQTIIDVGINAAPDGGLCGDVDFAAAENTVRAITPVPGGVGSVTTAILCRHLIEAAEAIAAGD